MNNHTLRLELKKLISYYSDLMCLGYFDPDARDAEEITNFIHFIGEGIVATYPYEIAEEKIIETKKIIKSKGYPLKINFKPSY